MLLPLPMLLRHENYAGCDYRTLPPHCYAPPHFYYVLFQMWSSAWNWCVLPIMRCCCCIFLVRQPTTTVCASTSFCRDSFAVVLLLR